MGEFFFWSLSVDRLECLSLFQNAQDYSIQYGDNVFGVTNALFITRAADERRWWWFLVVLLKKKKKKRLWGKKTGLDPGIISQARSGREAGRRKRKQQGGLRLGGFWGPEKMEGRAWKGARKQQKVIDIFFNCTVRADLLGRAWVHCGYCCCTTRGKKRSKARPGCAKHTVGAYHNNCASSVLVTWVRYHFRGHRLNPPKGGSRCSLFPRGGLTGGG